ncbi:MAG: archaemetzincin [Pyrinomonadaceae bacterium]
MPTRFSSLLLIVFGFLPLMCVGCSNADPAVSNVAMKAFDARAERIGRLKDAIVPFYRPMTVENGDWLDTQKEPGETFEEYIASNPTLPTAERRTIYIQPIGTFTAKQREAIRLTAEYMRAFYNLPVKLNADRQLGNVPNDKKRESGYPKRTQIRTQYFLDDVLPKLLKDDTAALIAFTNYDLYPGDTWAFVFGQATLQNRVGVWSLHRLSELSRNYPNALLDRTLKIAMHETGHMFSMRHCTKYECLMSGTNHLAETDRRPIDACPECMAKVAWAMNYDPELRYENLAAFWRKNGRKDFEKQMLEMAAAIEKLDSN